MKYTSLLISALLVSFFTLTAQAAPTRSWSGSDSMSLIEENIKDKQYQTAIDELNKIVESGKANADTYNLLGFTHRKLKYYDLAEAFYSQALSLNPKHKGALEYLGELYVETDRMDKANEMLGRLDEACFFYCKEYSALKEIIEHKEQGLEISSKW